MVYYEYLLVYVDDIIIISEVAKEILQQMKESYGYLLKDIGEPKSYLGADVGWQQGSYRDIWFLSPNTYVSKAITTVEGRLGSLKTMFGRSTCNTPVPTTFHPELDNTAFLGTDETQLYQRYIGILWWAVELG